MAGFEDYARRITERLELPEATKAEIRQEALADKPPVATDCLEQAMGRSCG